MARVVLTASEGMVYTNGTDGGKVVYLAEGETGDGWYEVPEPDFMDSVFSNQNEAGEDDYQAALKEFGVVL